jgi:hypothetical protein
VEERDAQLLLQLRTRPKLLNDFAVQNGSCSTEAARLGQRKEPLYVIVNGFQPIICPLLNVVEMTTAMIWFGATVKPDDLSVRQGAMASSLPPRDAVDMFFNDLPSQRKSVVSEREEDMADRVSVLLFGEGAMPSPKIKFDPTRGRSWTNATILRTI